MLHIKKYIQRIMYIASGKQTQDIHPDTVLRTNQCFQAIIITLGKLNKNQFKQLKIILIKKKFQHTSWLQPYKDPPASDSRVLRLNACTPKPEKNIYKKIKTIKKD